MTLGEHLKREADLADWSAETGRPLPFCAAAIILIEEKGGAVDLLTGQILGGVAEQRVTLTPAGVVRAYRIRRPRTARASGCRRQSLAGKQGGQA